MEIAPELLQHRREKLARLQEQKINPYPYRFERTHLSGEVLNHFSELETSGQTVKIAGRIIALRLHGKSLFGHLLDGAGKIQVYVKQDDVGEERFKLFELFDLGDFLGVAGPVFKTRTGEMTVKAKSFELLAKSLRPLPEKWHGLHDKELRYRQRYLDLVAGPEVKAVFVTRTRIIQAIRAFLDSQGFLEVETPILQPLYGGALARPFKTHHRTLDCDFYLRIADELYLKRLVIGGFEKVYEFCKDFRNEGMDKFHNPEFTMVELYWAYADYRDILALHRQLTLFVARQVFGTTRFTYQGQPVELDGQWEELPYFEGIKKFTGHDLYRKDEKTIRQAAEKLGIDTANLTTRGKLLDEIFSTKVEPNLIQPTFITDFPLEISPLAKRHRDQPELVERYELFIAGLELGNAFSELNDPLDQRQRFEELARLRLLGDEEASTIDEDFLTALEHGMPPTGGLGFGVDRLAMFFTDQHSIRDVIFFPQMRPEK